MQKNNSWGYLKHVLLPVLLYSGISGAFVGVVITLFNKGAELLAENSHKIYAFVRENLVWTPLFFIALGALALLMYFLLNRIPEVKGSGVPRTEGLLHGLLSFRWYRLFIGTIIGSFISFFSGLSLGSEGPSVQLGAATAQGVGEMSKNNYAWRRYISTGGAATGFAVSFGAPLTGIIFALEEVHKQFNPLLLVTVATAVLTGRFTSLAISGLWGGESVLFPIAGDLKAIPLEYSWVLLVIGLVCGGFAVLFNRLQLFADKKVSNKKTRQLITLLAVFLITGLCGLLCLDTVGSGSAVVHNMLMGNYAIKMVGVLLLLKLMLIVLGMYSGATGGLFIPMLSIGALLGGLCAEFSMVCGVSETYYSTIVLLSMAAFLGASIRTPITAMVLIVETTGPTAGFLSLGLEVFLAYIIAEVCQRKPIYDVFLEKEIERANEGKTLQNFTVELTVASGSFVDGKVVREVFWPVDCKLARICRAGENIVPDGKTRIQAGDLVLIQAEGYDCDRVEQDLCRLVTGEKKT